MLANLSIDQQAIAAFCRRWRIREVALFGSVLREDFGDQSDVDVLVAYEPDVRWTLLDEIRMQDELAAIVGRPVDLISRRAVERSANPLRRQAILDSARSIHVEG